MDYLEWYKLFVSMVAASILVHDALYICRDGKKYLTNCFLPTFGLYLKPNIKMLVHFSLWITCLALIWQPTSLFLYPVCLILLSLKIASYSLRLANHMIFAWFLLALLCIAGTRTIDGVITDDIIAFVLFGAQGLVLILYFFAFFHKLNRDYFEIETSCATAFVDFFCWDRKIVKPRLVNFYRYFGVYGTVIIEVAIPVFLYFEETRILGLFLGIGFHFILALIGIVNFSMFMYTGLLVFFPPKILSTVLQWPSASQMIWLVAGCVLIMAIVLRWTPRWAARQCPYAYRKPAWIIQLAFGGLTGCFLYACILLAGQTSQLQLPSWSTLSPVDRGVLWTVFAVFVFNGIGPYLGYKTEFSFAMFSNLRLDPWTHLLVPARWQIFKRPQYVEVKKIKGLPPGTAVHGNNAAELALHVLSKPKEYLYSRYFLREALRILEASVVPPPQISVGYMESGIYREVKGADLSKLVSCLPINRYPFVMPRNPFARHSEQGSLVESSEKRQLF